MSGGARLARCREREFTHPHRVSGFGGLFLGHSHRGHLRGDVRSAGDIAVVHRFRGQPGDVFGRYDRFGRGHVGQRRTAYNIADGVNPFGRSAVKRIDGHFPAFGLHARFFQSQIFEVGHHAGRRQDDLGGEPFFPLGRFDLHGHLPVGQHGRTGHFGRGQHLDAQLAEIALGLAGHFGVFHRQHTRQVFHHGHLRAHRGVKISQFGTDGPRSHHDHRNGQA